MKFKDKYKISKAFEDLFTFENEEDELEHDAQMLMFKFLEQLEQCHASGPGLKKKDLARALGKSQSYISQLYAGEKTLNLTLLAKIQKVFNITFDIKAHVNENDYAEKTSGPSIPNYTDEAGGCWVWINKTPDYSKSDEVYNDLEDPDKIIAA